MKFSHGWFHSGIYWLSIPKDMDFIRIFEGICHDAPTRVLSGTTGRKKRHPVANTRNRRELPDYQPKKKLPDPVAFMLLL
jgi:hypothetical protein